MQTLPMAGPLIVHRYWFLDEQTGRRRLTSTHLSAPEAAKRYPGAEPEPSSRERRWPAVSTASPSLDHPAEP